MGLSVNLQLRQSQSLVITPQLMQAIRLLQMTSLELDRFIEAELEQNPLLERAEAEESARGEAEPQASAPEEGGLDLDAGAEREPAEPDVDLPPYAPESARLATAAAAPEWSAIEERVAATESLEAFIERQIDNRLADERDRFIARVLLGHLDQAGYLVADLGAIAEELGAPPCRIERVLAACQTFEPTGVFARSLRECLALQLAERNRLDPAMQALLDNLALLAARNTAALRLACGVDAEDLAQMVAEIRALDPKPGAAFASEPVEPLVPDVLVRPASDGGWLVELNEANLPRVLIDRASYAQFVGRGDGETRRFVADCLQKANWLVRSLDQRSRTILKVSAEIVRQQEGFLAHGVCALKPLNLRMIADAVGVHESTVSRATAGKTMATPRGIFELKFFFSTALPASGGGEAHSAESVKHRIRTLIAGERPEAVLSDDSIVEMLNSDGIEIARRTVAKYREMMGIASSVQRRREKRAELAS
ncbi:RNA polymerase factor sigma-54 [Propylenella binzhouense]|uniref:RNA polymerase sigma-54 factor n=1 Tax=Propylenella binzhouense TaxID=2555902 RepID=A0A964T3E0_9HYPH|nr:RNA polymerase factor sigma-54 [Propylenella binzhouense]MYZ47640.1 RNA polymerase factor sigma-54 [Propylenella binzhouense]